jgi:Na+-translocating ferredoxin:NAD+ oxidoreductase RNF subunit RnfB
MQFITNGAIVIAGAISKKIPGGKQLVDKISSIVDKKKKVRTSKVGDKVFIYFSYTYILREKQSRFFKSFCKLNYHFIYLSLK